MLWLEAVEIGRVFISEQTIDMRKCMVELEQMRAILTCYTLERGHLINGKMRLSRNSTVTVNVDLVTGQIHAIDEGSTTKANIMVPDDSVALPELEGVVGMLLDRRVSGDNIYQFLKVENSLPKDIKKIVRLFDGAIAVYTEGDGVNPDPIYCYTVDTVLGVLGAHWEYFTRQ